MMTSLEHAAYVYKCTLLPLQWKQEASARAARIWLGLNDPEPKPLDPLHRSWAIEEQDRAARAYADMDFERDLGAVASFYEGYQQ